MTYIRLSNHKATHGNNILKKTLLSFKIQSIKISASYNQQQYVKDQYLIHNEVCSRVSVRFASLCVRWFDSESSRSSALPATAESTLSDQQALWEMSWADWEWGIPSRESVRLADSPTEHWDWIADLQTCASFDDPVQRAATKLFEHIMSNQHNLHRNENYHSHLAACSMHFICYTQPDWKLEKELERLYYE